MAHNFFGHSLFKPVKEQEAAGQIKNAQGSANCGLGLKIVFWRNTNQWRSTQGLTNGGRVFN
jgi:hypothetical protein